MFQLFNIFIICVYLFLVYKFHKNTTLLLLFTLATILILCNINKFTEGYSNYMLSDSLASADFDSLNNYSENFNKVETDPVEETKIPENDVEDKKRSVSEMADRITIPKALFTNYQMGPFDNLAITTGNPKSEYLKLMNNTLSKSEDICIYQGHENPLECKKTTGLNMGPTIDGVSGSPKSMFMFSNNKSSPNCCPSTFSTSTGCVCSTENQRNFLRGRGMGMSSGSELEYGPSLDDIGSPL